MELAHEILFLTLMAVLPVVVMAVWLSQVARDLPHRRRWWWTFSIITALLLPVTNHVAVGPNEFRIGDSLIVDRLPVPAFVKVKQNGKWRPRCWVPHWRQSDLTFWGAMLAVASANVGMVMMGGLLPVCLAARSARNKQVRGLAGSAGKATVLSSGSAN